MAASGFDPRIFREQVCSRPQVTFDELDTSPLHFAVKFVEILDGIVENGWEHHGGKIPSLKPPVPWLKFDRSFSYHLNAWEPLSYLLKGSCTVDDPARRQLYFQVSFDFAWDWLMTFQVPVLDTDPGLLLEEEATRKYGFAWYDMAVGLRACRLAFILDSACRNASYSDEVILFLYRSLSFHHRLLGVDSFFKAHSNHGLYQALGQLAASKRFADIDQASGAWFAFASQRLTQLISTQFTSDNVHKEHSPGYHFMVLGSLIGARQTDLIHDQATIGRVSDMEEALTWMINPGFWLATFGDTDPRHMVRTLERAARYGSPHMRGLVSGGEIGVLPGPGVRAYYAAGYAFARLFAQEVEKEHVNASYLAQTAAFHSRVHKQADHLSFIWYDKGRDILIDPGRYGYIGRTERGSELFKEGFWYSDPKRIYCESTKSHNAVEIDGKNYPRAKVKPFGSALTYAAEEDGCAVFCSAATHFRVVRHRRMLVMEPGHFLLVLDWLYDRSGAEHEYRQWFHFASDWQVTGEGDGILARHAGAGKEPAEMRAVSLTKGAALGPVVRGQEEPELLGWLSDAANSFVPTSCFSTSVKSNEPAILATLFVFGARLEVDRKHIGFNRTLTAGRVCWTDDRGEHALDLQRHISVESWKER